QKVQRHPLAFEQRTRAAPDVGYDLAVLTAIAIALEYAEFVYSAAQPVDLGEQIQSGNDERLAREKTAGGHAPLRNAGRAREVASADIFLKRELHDRHSSFSRWTLYSASLA